MLSVGSSYTTKHLCIGNSSTHGSEIHTRRLSDNKQCYQHAAGAKLEHTRREKVESKSYHTLSDHTSDRGISAVSYAQGPLH